MSFGPVSSQSSLATDSDEVLVRVEGVSKKFCRSLKQSLWYGLCDIAGELNPFTERGAGNGERGDSGAAGVAGEGLLVGNGRKKDASELAPSYSPLVTSPPLRSGEFWAVNDVSFELRRGECLGLIGHNGAGKTTLLKMLNGLIKPDTGRIEMNGRVGALIALGAGFNPVLTGRENIYIYGSVLGLDRREIARIIDEIIDFAEIREFIDMPVQSYSSGMAVRLGFAVASSLRPDILLLDEVLAVGDRSFVVKCFNRLREMASNSAVVLVSHNMQAIAGFCTRVIMMDKGCLLTDTSNVWDALDLYLESNERMTSTAGTGEVLLENCEILDFHGSAAPRLKREIRISFKVLPSIQGAECQINITDMAGTAVMGIPVLNQHGISRVFSAGRHTIKFPFESLDLNTGQYGCTLIFREPVSKKIYCRIEGGAFFRLNSEKHCIGAPVVKAVVLGDQHC